jgi:hypothetical protein
MPYALNGLIRKLQNYNNGTVRITLTWLVPYVLLENPTMADPAELSSVSECPKAAENTGSEMQLQPSRVLNSRENPFLNHSCQSSVARFLILHE